MMNEQMIRLEEQQKVMIDKIDALEHRLFGNGQPGLIASITSRLKRLEVSITLFMGGGAVLVWLLEKGWVTLNAYIR